MTIVEAIKAVLAEPTQPLTSRAIYCAIVARHLYDFKAKDPESVVNSQIRRHCVGLDFPSSSPVKHFRVVEGHRYVLKDAPIPQISPVSRQERDEDKVPEEMIEEAHGKHFELLKQQLLEAILGAPPEFFERLVIDLLLKMGYGGTNPPPDAGLHIGRPGDGGIDGVIRQDELGLELIYLQAKRYGLDRKVQEPEIRSFAGALSKVQKGVFITTAEFADKAKTFAKHHEKRIILLNGDALTHLMIKHGIGLTELRTYKTLRVDNDYFSEGP
jgi:restriction system protein